MGDTSGCQISSNNLAVYLQGVTVEPSFNLTSDYFVTASLPSSASLRRVWQFTTQGTITGPDTATLTLDYTQARENCPEYNITFEGALNGTLTVKNQVFSANKFMSYTLTSAYVLVLTLRVPKSIQECYGTGTTQNYSFSVFLNDATDANCTTYTDSSGNYTFLPLLNETGGSVTLSNNSADTVTINYLYAGGGGGGGGGKGSYAGGGGGGFVSIGTFTVDSSGSVQCNYSVGAGGSAGSSGNTGKSGGTTTLLVIDGTTVLVDGSASGGGGGEGAGTGAGGNGGDSGFSDSSGNVTYEGGEGCSDSDGNIYAGGGGAGASSNGTSPNCSTQDTKANGGNGYEWIDGNYYGGGGGGGGSQVLSGTGGKGGGGSGGSAGTPSTGGGGGGGPQPQGPDKGGSGGSGICVLAWSTMLSPNITISNCS